MAEIDSGSLILLITSLFGVSFIATAGMWREISAIKESVGTIRVQIAEIRIKCKLQGD